LFSEAAWERPIASFRMERLVFVSKVLRNSYRTRMREPAAIVEILVDLSVKSRIRGLHTLVEDERETSILFLRRALGFVVDNYSREQTTDILNTEMYFFKQRRDESERVLRVMADICPAIGLAGSVVGLIGMLSGVNDTGVVLATIPIALTSTLYGVILANFVFLPLAARIREVTDHDLLAEDHHRGCAGHTERAQSPRARSEAQILSHSLGAGRAAGLPGADQGAFPDPGT